MSIPIFSVFDRHWQMLGLCVTTRDRNLYGARPDTSGVYREPSGDDAKRLCNGCSVTAQCLAYAFLVKIDTGIAGGASAKQRRAIRKFPKLVAALIERAAHVEETRKHLAKGEEYRRYNRIA